jgi:hypothetical protein
MWKEAKSCARAAVACGVVVDSLGALDLEIFDDLAYRHMTISIYSCHRFDFYRHVQFSSLSTL